MEKKTLQSIIREIPKTGTILENVFYNSNLEEENYDIPFTFLCFLENLAYFNSFKSNYIIDVDETIIPFALYTMSFLGSGDKKDTAFDKIRTYLFSSFVQERKAEVLLKYEERKKAIVEEIENEYAGLKMEDTAITQTKKREAINERLKNLRLPEADFLSIDDTFEGLVTERIWYQSIGLGCPFVKSSEAVSFFQNAGADREPLLRHIIEAYDTGNGQGKTTKGEGKSLSITNVPIALHMHSTATDDLPKRLSHFLDIGGSRRCIIYAPDKPKQESENMEEMSIDDIFNNLPKELKPIKIENFTELREQIAKTLQNRPYIQLTDEIKELAKKLHKYYSLQPKTNKNIRDIPYRALRVAGILQLLADEESDYLLIKYYKSAVEIVEFYANTTKKILNSNNSDSLFEKLLNKILETPDWKMGKFEIIKNLKVYPSQEPNRAINNFIEYAKDSGYMVEKYKVNRGEGIRLYVQEEAKDEDIKISINKSLEPKATDFIPLEIKWSEFENITGKNQSWSATTFKSNKRKDENAEGIRVIGLDIDNGMSLEEAKAFFETRKLECLISTTKSHKKEKNGIIADRFRIVLLLDKEYFLDKADYKARMVNLYDDLKLPFDRSTQNISRLWFGNANAIHYRIKGFALCFDDYKPKPITEAKTIKLFNEYTNDRGLINHWIQSGTIGNRYNELYKAFQYYRDENLSFPEIADKINTINNTFSMPHKQEKIDKELEKWRKEFPC